jgi:hypothetical protein
MRRPEWAGTSAFAPAWNGAVELLARADLNGAATTTLGLLAEARVIVLPAAQVAVLPELEAPDIPDVLVHEALPFDPLFLDYGRLSAEAIFPRYGVNYGGPGDLGPLLITSKLAPPEIAGPAVIAFLHKGSRVYPPGISVGVSVANGQELAAVPHCAAAEEAVGFDHQRSLQVATGHADLSARLLRFLSCINVELVDASVSRQERRAAERKGGRIAQIVYIRQNRRRPASEAQGMIDWSHRWEVRGHYKHFPKGTRLADAAPGKLSWEPTRNAYVRRIWCPPYVKGPESKPLLPKTHAVPS